MEYYRTKDILHVKEKLGHRRIESTLVYTRLVSFEGDEYHVKTLKTSKRTKNCLRQVLNTLQTATELRSTAKENSETFT